MSFKILDRRESIRMSLKLESMEEMDEIAGDKDDTSCGIGGCHPNWLQKLNTPKSFLVNNGLLGLLNGATFAYFIGCMSTLEKRYAFESKMSGIIMIGEEISPLFFGFLIGYFGGRPNRHRPRFIAFAMTIGLLSSFVMASPYFLYGAIRDSTSLDRYKNTTDFELCDLKEKDYFCDKYPTLTAVTILLIGTVMKGFAVNAFYTVGTPYLDDNIKKKNTSMYFATSMIIQLIGPTFGFLLSSFCLQFYEDPFYDPGYGTDDPRWIGAWWLGYVTIGTLMFICSLPMWLFPRRFPGAKIPKIVENEDDSNYCTKTLKSMGNAWKRLAKNPILVCHELADIWRTNGVLGYYILMPKYIEMQFKQSASKANLFSGPISIVAMQLGILLGAVLLKKFQPRARVMTGCLVFIETIGIISFFIGMLITCPTSYTNENNSFTDSLLNLENDCNRDCLCTTKFYTPICGPDGQTTYFSPCHAGCSDYNKTGGAEDEMIYTDCKCVHDEAGQMITGQTTSGYCNFGCDWLIVYIVMISLGRLLSSTTSVPNAIILLRCVNPEDKSIALGALSGIYSILAFLQFPLIYGAISDSCCLLWEHSCDKTGNCWIYDIDKFRYMLHGVSTVYLVAGNIMDVFVWYLSPRLKNLYEDEEKIDEKSNDIKMDVKIPPDFNGSEYNNIKNLTKIPNDYNNIDKDEYSKDVKNDILSENNSDTEYEEKTSRC